jgi:hypothetical protein
MATAAIIIDDRRVCGRNELRPYENDEIVRLTNDVVGARFIAPGFSNTQKKSKAELSPGLRDSPLHSFAGLTQRRC